MRTNAIPVLHRRYMKGDPKREASLRAERLHASIACLIYTTRKKIGLTQKELAELAGTTQSVICRLEEADYQGHSLSLVWRIAEALGHKLTVRMVPLGRGQRKAKRTGDCL